MQCGRPESVLHSRVPKASASLTNQTNTFSRLGQWVCVYVLGVTAGGGGSLLLPLREKVDRRVSAETDEG